MDSGGPNFKQEVHYLWGAGSGKYKCGLEQRARHVRETRRPRAMSECGSEERTQKGWRPGKSVGPGQVGSRGRSNQRPISHV